MALRVENERVDASVSKCDKQQAKKYRPITSLVTVNKTFEHILSKRSDHFT